jgi:hypothetical protein
MYKINKPDFFVLCEIVYHFQIDRNLAYLKKNKKKYPFLFPSENKTYLVLKP